MVFSRRRFRPPVRTNKEIIDAVLLGTPAGTVSEISIATAVNDYTGGVGDCPIGSKIKAIWIDNSYTSGSEIPGRMDWLVQKIPGTLPGATPGGTGGQLVRKFIFLERKGLNNTVATGSGNNPRAAAGWLMVPKRFQNMAEGDRIVCRFSASEIYDMCFKFIYKWMA